jgi:hypothetical protein
VPDATEYQLSIEDGDPTGSVAERTITAAEAGCAAGGTCRVALSTALAAGLANWRVRAVNADGDGPWSDWLAFAVCVGTLPPADAPALLGPSGSIDTSLPTYRFAAVEDATKYFLWVQGPSGSDIQQVFGAAEAGCVDAANACAVTPTRPLASGLSEWWVQAQNSGGEGPWSAKFTVIVGGDAPPSLAPTPLEPTGTTESTTPQYEWSPVPTATRYSLWVNDSSATRVNAVYSAADVGCDGGGTCSVAPPAALVPGLATWWVRAENTMGEGPWSSPTLFTVAGGPAAPAAAPVLLAPLGTITEDRPTYSWESVAHAAEYYLWVTDHAGPRIQEVYTAASAGCAGGGTCAVTPSSVLPAGLTNWWVRAQNSGGTSDWSAAGAFNVGGGVAPSGVPSLLSPIASADSATPTYEWSAVTDASEYLLWVNDSRGERVQRVVTADEAGCSDGTCSAQPDTRVLAGVVKWWVRAHNVFGAGLWSAGESFAFCATDSLNFAPRLLAPSGTASASPRYEWSAVRGATDYFLWVNDASGPRVRQIVDAAGASCGEGGMCVLTPSTPLAPGSCRFWVRAQNSMGPGPWSAALSFSAGGS